MQEKNVVRTAFIRDVAFREPSGTEEAALSFMVDFDGCGHAMVVRGQEIDGFFRRLQIEGPLQLEGRDCLIWQAGDSFSVFQIN